MGISGVSKGQVYMLSQDIDERLKDFLQRSTEVKLPYVWIDATYM